MGAKIYWENYTVPQLELEGVLLAKHYFLELQRGFEHEPQLNELLVQRMHEDFRRTLGLPDGETADKTG